MGRLVEAVYEGGVLRPVELLDLQEGERVSVQLQADELGRKRAEEVLAKAARVYEGLSEEEIAEVEKIALDRSHWIRGRHRG